MENLIQSQIITAAVQLERQLDSELNRLDALDSDDLQALRDQRMREMKKLQEQKQTWLNNGHGVYTELADEKEFFEVSKKSPNIICHFYRDGAERCKIVDMHLAILAKKHIEAKFCKVNAEKSPFLTQRLRIKVIPTIACIKDSKTKDYVVGFTDLGNRDDFSTEMMEWRLAKSLAIKYDVSGTICVGLVSVTNLVLSLYLQGDLLTPPDEKRKQKAFLTQQKKTIRGGYDSDDSDIDFDD